MNDPEFWSGFAIGGLLCLPLGAVLAICVMVVAAVLRERTDRKDGG